MGTSAHIAIKKDVGYLITRVNWDGYPEHMSKALAHYASEESVQMLIEGGEIRGIDAQSGSVEYYPEHDNMGYPCPSPEPDTGEEFSYVFEDGSWWLVCESRGLVNLESYEAESS